MSRSQRMLRSLASLAGAAMSTTGFAAAWADTVQVQKTIRPFIAASAFITKGDRDVASCFFFLCDNESLFEPGPPPAPIAEGRVTVGFKHVYDSGTSPCNCASWNATASRGTVLFRTLDIPARFRKATLVLTNVASVSSDPNAMAPFSAIFRQDSMPDPTLQGDIVFDPATGQITAHFSHPDTPFDPDPLLGKALFNPFPQPPFPSGIETTPPFNFRIDVTSTVNDWVKDWPSRNVTPLRGFTLVGTDESLPSDSNTALRATYVVILVFDIDEPDR